MYLCGNMCNGDTIEPQITIKMNQLHPKVLGSYETKNDQGTRKSSLKIRKSKYKEYYEECKSKNKKFTDKQFAPNQKNLQFKVEGRQLVWKRAGEIISDSVLWSGEIITQEICQANLGDCYFLSCITSLALVQERIQSIFCQNCSVSEYGIYKMIVTSQGVPTQIVIDDYVPVFAETDRPVFSKPTRNQIWVMLIEKVWAKIKGSYGAISSGSPHEVLNTFSVAPCYFYPVQQEDKDYQDLLWSELSQAADQGMPVVAGSRQDVQIAGLLPCYAYTIVDCQTIKSHNKEYRIIKLINAWSKIEYSGFASVDDNQFWNGVDPQLVQKFRPRIGVKFRQSTLPFQEFIKNFISVDISKCKFGFSYDFQKVKMYKGEPLFVRLNVKEQHEGHIIVKRDSSENETISSYGFARIVVSLQRDIESFEYYGSCLEGDFPDLCHHLTFKPGSYLIMIEMQDPRMLDEFQFTFGYYYDSLSDLDGKQIIIQYGKKYIKFLEQTWYNHAIRMNDEKSKIGPKPQDWIKHQFLYNEGAYGYVVCNLQQDTSIRMSVLISKNQIKQSGFYLLGQHPQQLILTAGCTKTFVFSCILGGEGAGNMTFPPAGFKISRIA